MELVTGDAHGLYGQLGFSPLRKPKNYMELHRPTFTSETAPKISFAECVR